MSERGALMACIIPPPLPGDTQIIAHQVLQGETCWLGPAPRKGSPRERIDSDLFFTFSPVCPGLRRRKLNDYETLPPLPPQPLTSSPFLQTPPLGLWMTVSRRGIPLDIVCNVFLNCPPSVPPTALSGSRQGSAAKCVDRRRSKCEE